MSAIVPRDKGLTPTQHAFAACYTGKLSQTQKILKDAGFDVSVGTLTVWEKTKWFVDLQEEMRSKALTLAKNKVRAEGHGLAEAIASKEDILAFWTKVMQDDGVVEQKDKDGYVISSKPNVALENRIKVSELLMRYHGGFVERVETTTVAPPTAKEVDIKDRLMQMMAEEGKVLKHEDITIFKITQDESGGEKQVEKTRTSKDWIDDL